MTTFRLLDQSRIFHIHCNPLGPPSTVQPDLDPNIMALDYILTAALQRRHLWVMKGGKGEKKIAWEGLGKLRKERASGWRFPTVLGKVPEV